MFVPWVQIFDLIRRIDRNPLKQFHLQSNKILNVLAQQAADSAYDMRSKESRRTWEAAFSATVVTPLLTVCQIFVIVQVLLLLSVESLIFFFLSFRTLKRKFNGAYKCWLVTSGSVSSFPHETITICDLGRWYPSSKKSHQLV